jgi:hypothetical protein
MKRTVPLTVALLCSALLALACVVEDRSPITVIGTPTPARPPNFPPGAPNLTPVLPPPPVAPAAGTYFGQITAIDPAASVVTFSFVCLGADRKSMRELPKNDQVPRNIPIAPTTMLNVFTSPPGNPAAGRMSPVDLPALAEFARSNPTAKWWMMADPAAVTAIEQDSGVRSSRQPDDPCPH